MILKTKEASKYIGVSINTLKTLANNGKIKAFKTEGGHRRFRIEDLDLFSGKVTEKKEKVAVWRKTEHGSPKFTVLRVI